MGNCVGVIAALQAWYLMYIMYPIHSVYFTQIMILGLVLVVSSYNKYLFDYVSFALFSFTHMVDSQWSRE